MTARVSQASDDARTGLVAPGVFRNATVRKTPAIGTLTRPAGAEGRKAEESPRPRTAKRDCARGVRHRTQLRPNEMHLGCFMRVFMR
ncbi:hypothetical protein Stube_32270 [Streptomyces tubercidicus]|uniref:Uncharacterized protein n=1 Tax=Streptomyces tubercidicus TaxID=47759 RepID=A0A640UT49_9ACTN|nr:hypothetical protein Stube_32270 [Streptomyces tubercidicus]